ANWIRAAHGDLTPILHDERAVPLEHRYFLDGKAHLIVDADGRRRSSFKGVGGELARRITRPGNWGEQPGRPWQDDEPEERAEDDGRRPGNKPRERRPAEPWEVLRALERERL